MIYKQIFELEEKNRKVLNDLLDNILKIIRENYGKIDINSEVDIMFLLGVNINDRILSFCINKFNSGSTNRFGTIDNFLDIYIENILRSIGAVKITHEVDKECH